MLVLATKSNGKIDEKSFKSAVKQPRVFTTDDLTFQGDGKFKIAGKFLTGQEAHQGWNVSPDAESGKVYLLKVVDADKANFGLFLKGDRTTTNFKSVAVEYAFNSVGLDLTKPLTLTRVDGLPGAEGFIAYEVTNKAVVEEEGEAPTLDIPSEDGSIDSTDTTAVSVVTDSQISTDSVIDDAPIMNTQEYVTPEQIAAFAQPGVEEQPVEGQDPTLLS